MATCTGVGSLSEGTGSVESGEIEARLRAAVARDLAEPNVAMLGPEDRREFARQRILAWLERHAGERFAQGRPALAPGEERSIAQRVLDALFGLGRLQALVDDPTIENIDVNGYDRVWITRADGTKEAGAPVAESDEALIEVIRSAAARLGLSERRFDTGRPELDLRLPDGSRLSAVMAVSARPAVSIRRHRFVDVTLDDLVAMGSMGGEVASLLAAAVRARKNIVVSGAMNTGKTTLLRALAAEIPPRERLVTIEQAFELALDRVPARHPDVVALEARPANVEGEGEIGVAALVRRALRMNADRVIVGEVLGGEIIPMLNAMSQGRSGSMCTIHADSSAGAFRRIASYAVQAPERLPVESTNLLIAGAIHFVVHLDVEATVVTEPPGPDRRPPFLSGEPGRFDGPADPEVPDPWATGPGVIFGPPARRCRFVSSVREVVDVDGSQLLSNELFCPGTGRRAEPAAPLRPDTRRELVAVGYDPDLRSGAALVGR